MRRSVRLNFDKEEEKKKEMALRMIAIDKVIYTPIERKRKKRKARRVDRIVRKSGSETRKKNTEELDDSVNRITWLHSRGRGFVYAN